MFTPRSAAFVAFSSGDLSAVLLRPGSHCRLVLEARFSSARGAHRFARLAARRAGRSVIVRRFGRPPDPNRVFAVSCPVSCPHTRPPACLSRPVSWSGGLRGFIAALSAAGLPKVWDNAESLG